MQMSWVQQLRKDAEFSRFILKGWWTGFHWSSSAAQKEPKTYSFLIKHFRCFSKLDLQIFHHRCRRRQGGSVYWNFLTLPIEQHFKVSFTHFRRQGKFPFRPSKRRNMKTGFHFVFFFFFFRAKNRRDDAWGV